MELATTLRERKDVLCCLQEKTAKLKKISGFTEASIQGCETSKHLLCQAMIKERCMCKLLTKVNLLKVQSIESIIVHLCSEPVV